MLGAVGVSPSADDVKGAALASYLLFESSYTQELMALGYADANKQCAEICQFFDWDASRIQDAPPPRSTPGRPATRPASAALARPNRALRTFQGMTSTYS